jgi:hypothetical protein
MKIAILQTVTPEIASYTKYTVGVNAQYCVENGIEYHLVQNDLGTTRHPSWNRIKVVGRFVSQYDFVMMLDADAIIQNFSISLEEIINTHAEDYDILVCDDKPNGGLINCGVMIFRNTPSIHDILTKWWIEGAIMEMEHKFPYEQGVLRALMENPDSSPVWRNKIKILPINTFNSHWLDIPEDNFIAHIMARPMDQRIAELSERFQKVIKNW